MYTVRVRKACFKGSCSVICFRIAQNISSKVIFHDLLFKLKKKHPKQNLFRLLNWKQEVINKQIISTRLHSSVYTYPVLLRSRTSSVLMRSSVLVRGSWVSGSPWSWRDSDRSMKKTRMAWRQRGRVKQKHQNSPERLTLNSPNQNNSQDLNKPSPKIKYILIIYNCGFLLEAFPAKSYNFQIRKHIKIQMSKPKTAPNPSASKVQSSSHLHVNHCRSRKFTALPMIFVFAWTYPARLLHVSTRKPLYKVDACKRGSSGWQQHRGIHHQVLHIKRFTLQHTCAQTYGPGESDWL